MNLLCRAPVPGAPQKTLAGARGVGTLFQEDWWLEAASGGLVQHVDVHWDALRVAKLSFMSRSRLGVRTLEPPPYTRTLGPVVTLPPSKPTQYALNLQRVARELRAKLPPHDRFHQQLDPGSEMAFPFSLAGFQVSQHFTFRAQPFQDPDALLSNLDPATRRLVKAGTTTLTVREHGDGARFLALADRDRGPGENTHDTPALKRLFEASLARGQGIFLAVVDAKGRDLAGVFLVWDRSTLYYLVPVRDRAVSGGGTNAFLVWSALSFALGRGLAFDFDSYASVGTARFLSSFGLTPQARSVVSFRSRRFRAIDLMRSRNVPVEAGILQPDMDCIVKLGNARASCRERALLTLRGKPRDAAPLLELPPSRAFPPGGKAPGRGAAEPGGGPRA